MIHRSLFFDVGAIHESPLLFDESLPACEDYDLWLRLSARFPVGLIETPYVIKYGGHADQRSRQFPAMDRFRIYSLKKILDSGLLTDEQTNAAQKMLEEKERIYLQGALKRGQGCVILRPQADPKGLLRGESSAQILRLARPEQCRRPALAQDDTRRAQDDEFNETLPA